MQTDLETYLKTYNYDRPHQGRNMLGRTPYTVFIDGLPKNDDSDTEDYKLAA